MAVANEELQAFRDMLEAKVNDPEAPAETPEEPTATPEEAPAEAEATPEAPTEEAPAAEKTDDELILGRFKNQDDLAEAYSNLERKLGEQGQEVGELRALKDQFDQLRQQVTEPGYTADEFQATVAEDPAYAAQLAYQKKDERGLEKALAEWRDQDPFAAATWVNDIKIAKATEQLRGEYEQKMQTVTAFTAQQQTNQAVGQLAQQFPDLEQLAPEMGQVARERPHLLQALQSGDPAVRGQVIEDLYRIARDRRQDTVQTETTKIQAQQEQETRQAKTDATVASASSAPVQEDKSPVDQAKQRILDSSGLSIQAELARIGLTPNQ